MSRLSIGDLHFEAPADYTVKMVIVTAPQKPQAGAGAKRFLQQERPYVRNVVVGREDIPEGMTLAVYVDRQMEIMAAQMPGFRKLKQTTITIRGHECPLVEGQGQGPEGMLLSTLTTYVPGDGVVFTISATHLAGIPFQDTKPEYLKIFQSFSLG
jgi:hypothetical protein